MTQGKGIGRGVGGGRPRAWKEKIITTLCFPPFIIDLCKDLGFITPGRALYHLLKEKHRTNNKEYNLHPREFYDNHFKAQEDLDREIIQGKEESQERQYEVLSQYLRSLKGSDVPVFKARVLMGDQEAISQYQEAIARLYRIRVSPEVMKARAAWQSPTGPGMVFKGGSADDSP